jgi:diguanylate cyclase (GGDEF)-like protein/PAS domain S-box-containing protein
LNSITFRILIIDDNPAIHRDFVKILTISKKSLAMEKLDTELFDIDPSTQMEASLPEFQIDTASQGQEGVNKVKHALTDGNSYALAFVDIRMPPGLDGVETIKKIWEIDSNIQIVICSAYSDYSWEDTIRQLGVSDNLLMLKKPFDVIAVRQLASALTQKWCLAMETRKHAESLNKLVTERTASLQQSLSLLRATIESSSDGILVIDLNKKIVDYNSQFAKIWEISASTLALNDKDILLQTMLGKLLNPTKYLMLVETLDENIDDTAMLTVKFKKDKIIECCSKPHRVNDNIVGRVWSFRDITEQIQLKIKLEYQATHDTLTGLPNRSLLTDRIQSAIVSSLRYKKKFAVLFFDLDRFKLINDSLSHTAGDELLCAVAKRLSETIRQEDTLSRLGGDEFVMVILSISKEEHLVSLTQKIISSLKPPFFIAGHELNVSTSIGISIYPTDGITVNTLLSNADLAMYHAKELGGNQFSFYTNQLNEQSHWQFLQEVGLQRALTNNEFFLMYQPQMDIEKRKVLSVEALVRWHHPENGVICPLDFIPVAENSGLIVPIGEWVIREVCRQISEWRKKGLPLLRVAINTAAKQLKQRNFSKIIGAILEEFDVSPECIEIEVTENVIVSHPDVQKTLLELAEMGILIVLDDFGTGNSSLNSLKQVTVNRLKIDQSFIKNISKSRGDEVIVEAIIAISKSFGFKVMAEGVETKKQLEFLTKRSCDEVQGFLLSKPLTNDELEVFMNNPLSF